MRAFTVYKELLLQNEYGDPHFYFKIKFLPDKQPVGKDWKKIYVQLLVQRNYHNSFLL